MQVFINLITRAFFMSTPLILGALGEVIAERTGMMVTAVEGIFLIGAWGGFIGAYLSGNMLIGFLAAMVCGLLVSLLYGPASDRYGNRDRYFGHRFLYVFLSGDLRSADCSSYSGSFAGHPDSIAVGDSVYRADSVFAEYYYIHHVYFGSGHILCYL